MSHDIPILYVARRNADVSEYRTNSDERTHAAQRIAFIFPLASTVLRAVRKNIARKGPTEKKQGFTHTRGAERIKQTGRTKIRTKWRL